MSDYQQYSSVLVVMSFVAFLGGGAIIALSILMTFIMPKKITSKYLREPHFHPSVTQFCESFYYRCIFTQVLVLMANIKWLALYRKAPDFVADCPRWWLITARIYYWGLFLPVAVSYATLAIQYAFFGLGPNDTSMF